MNRQFVWIIVLFSSLVSAGNRTFGQTPAEGKVILKSVEWPGLGKTTAVCVKKDGLYVCVIPEGEEQTDRSPKVFNENGELLPAKVLHMDKKCGVCLLETDAESGKNALPLSTREDVLPGEELTTVLPTAELETKLAGKDRIYMGSELPAPMLRLRAGNSTEWLPGTPVINRAGELEGVISGKKLPMTDETHAIPADVIRKAIVDLENHNKSAPIWLGMVLRSNCSTPEVIEVKKASPAERAGIKPRDIILAINTQRINEIDDLVEALKTLPGKTAATFKVLRGLDEVELSVVPEFVE